MVGEMRSGAANLPADYLKSIQRRTNVAAALPGGPAEPDWLPHPNFVRRTSSLVVTHSVTMCETAIGPCPQPFSSKVDIYTYFSLLNFFLHVLPL
jgi:hypothetical protein